MLNLDSGGNERSSNVSVSATRSMGCPAMLPLRSTTNTNSFFSSMLSTSVLLRGGGTKVSCMATLLCSSSSSCDNNHESARNNEQKNNNNTRNKDRKKQNTDQLRACVKRLRLFDEQHHITVERHSALVEVNERMARIHRAHTARVRRRNFAVNTQSEQKKHRQGEVT